MNEILRESQQAQAKRVGTGLERSARTVSLGASKGQSTRGETETAGEEAVSGNSANTAVVATANAKKVRSLFATLPPVRTDTIWWHVSGP